jgi:hypothetical protein
VWSSLCRQDTQDHAIAPAALNSLCPAAPLPPPPHPPNPQEEAAKQEAEAQRRQQQEASKKKAAKTKGSKEKATASKPSAKEAEEAERREREAAERAEREEAERVKRLEQLEAIRKQVRGRRGVGFWRCAMLVGVPYSCQASSRGSCVVWCTPLVPRLLGKSCNRHWAHASGRGYPPTLWQWHGLH